MHEQEAGDSFYVIERGSAEYKRQMAGVFVRRALRGAWDRASREAA